jgi:hypothetical protein
MSYKTLLIAVLAVLVMPSHAQILGKLRREIRRDFNDKMEKLIADKASEIIVSAVMRPVEKAFDDLIREAYQADSAKYANNPQYADSLRYQRFENYVATLNRGMENVPDSYTFDRSITYEFKENVSKREMTMHFSDDQEYMAFEQKDAEKGAKSYIVFDFERNINVLYSIDKKGEKSFQAIPSLIGSSGTFQISEENKENIKEFSQWSKTGKTKEIIGYQCDEYFFQEGNVSNYFYIARDFPSIYKNAYFEAVYKYFPNKGTERMNEIKGTLMEAESKDETKNYHSRMTVVDYSEKSWTLSNYK